ncbi:MAG: TlyA family RNA methyltransferase [Candidatus Melainabacteria bacterium]|nr:TlyA family RNA methyltransferase [Candidatus Melainabacteria bacterium]
MAHSTSKAKRLDLLVLELGLLATRQAAQAAIMDGGILVNGKPVTKPGTNVGLDAKINVAPHWGPAKYVSRGGLKLEKALATFLVNPTSRVCLDIGASTGGFTDCLLKHGAACVYAIDVGYGQLDWSLRQDSRVVVKERINARLLCPEKLYSPGIPWANLAAIDVSFISVAKILPACLQVLSKEHAEIICLIKPQFEAGRSLVSKGGVVKSPAIHINVINALCATAQALGLTTVGLTFSPIKGPAGNIEYLVHWTRGTVTIQPDVTGIVQQANDTLSSEY